MAYFHLLLHIKYTTINPTMANITSNPVGFGGGVGVGIDLSIGVCVGWGVGVGEVALDT